MRIYINICMYIYVILFIEDIGQHVNSDYFWEVGLQVILLIILILMLLCISNFLQWAHIIIYFLSCVLFLKSEKKVEVLENLLLPRSGSGANTWGQTLNCCGWSLVRGSAVLGLWGARGPGAQTWSWFVQEFTVLTLALVTSLLVSTKRTSQVSSREKGRSRRERYLRSTLTDWSVSTGHPGWEREAGRGGRVWLLLGRFPLRTLPVHWGSRQWPGSGQITLWHQSCFLPIIFTDEKCERAVEHLVSRPLPATRSSNKRLVASG